MTATRALLLAAGRGSASILAAVWMIWNAHSLSLRDFGDLNLGMALALVLGILSDLGLQTVLAMDVVEAGRIRRRLLDRVVRRRLLSAGLAGTILVPLYMLATREGDPAVPALFGLSLLGGAMYAPAGAAYRTRGGVGLDMSGEILSRAVLLLLSLVAIAAGGGLVAVAGIYSTVTLATGLCAYAWVRRQAEAMVAGEEYPRLGLPATAPFIWANGLGAVYQRADNYLVGLLKGSAVVGLYGASYRLQDAVMILPTAISQLSLAELTGQGKRARLRVAQRIAVLSLLAALLPATGIALLANPILTHLFGARFDRATSILIVLMVATLPGAVATGLSTISVITDAPNYVRISAASLGINVVANLLLIPPLGGLGAAIANVVSQAFLAGALYWLVHQRLREDNVLATVNSTT